MVCPWTIRKNLRIIINDRKNKEVAMPVGIIGEGDTFCTPTKASQIEASEKTFAKCFRNLSEPKEVKRKDSFQCFQIYQI